METNLDQQEQLTEDDNLRSLMMIGGIGLFLPFAEKEAEICVAYGATTTEEQSAETVREELEQVFETTQVEEAEEENEHSEECPNAFSQEAERVVALELTAKEAEGEDEHYEE
jgi:hypothetical protein